MTDNSSEIPRSMHELAEQKLKQAHAAYNQLTSYMDHAIGTWMGAVPPGPGAAGLKTFHDQAMEVAKVNAEFRVRLRRQDGDCDDSPGVFGASDAVRSRPDAGLR